MPSGELVGTTLKFTGREVTDGHSHFPTPRSGLYISMHEKGLRYAIF